MSKKQLLFYLKNGVASDKLKIVSSYVEPLVGKCCERFKRDIDFFFDEKTLVCSGYPTKIYNHDWGIKYVLGNSHYKLAIFIYGHDNMLEQLAKLASQCDRIRIFVNCSEKLFHYALRKSCCYLRPTSEDSFGITVADAVFFGVDVIASDVCQRYPGTNLFNANKYLDFEHNLNLLLNGDHKQLRVENRQFLPFSYNSVLGKKNEAKTPRHD